MHSLQSLTLTHDSYVLRTTRVLLLFCVCFRQVTMNDGYSYTVRRRYSQFDQLRERVARFLRHVTPPFPPKHGVRSATMGLPANIIEERRWVDRK